jgi:hemerythrin
MFEWKAEYSVGIASIDGQHQNLFALARELYSAMSSGHGKSAVRPILDRLVQYTKVHFGHEERLMVQHNYPDLAEHKKQHDALTKRVVEFQADYEAGKVAMTIQLLQFLKTWLEHHIRESDGAYSPYMKARAVV